MASRRRHTRLWKGRWRGVATKNVTDSPQRHRHPRRMQIKTGTHRREASDRRTNGGTQGNEVTTMKHSQRLRRRADTLPPSPSLVDMEAAAGEPTQPRRMHRRDERCRHGASVGGGGGGGGGGERVGVENGRTSRTRGERRRRVGRTTAGGAKRSGCGGIE